MIFKKAIFEDSDIFTRIVLLLTIMLATTIVGSALWYVFSDADITNIDSLKLLQFLQSVGMFVLPPFILAFLWSKKPLESLRLTVFPSKASFLVLLALMLVAIPGINLLTYLNQQIVLPEFLHGLEQWIESSEEEAELLTEKLVNVNTLTGLVINILLISVIPAFGEELFFRGSVFQILNQWKSKVFAVWISALIFSAVHFQFYGFIPRLLLGALFGYLLIWSRSMWLPIFAHFLNNFIAVVFYYLKHNGYKVIDLDQIGTVKTLWLGVLSVMISILMIRQIKVHLRKKL